MKQEVFNWLWLALLVVAIVVRKFHEHKAGRRPTLKGTPIAEASLMVLWGVAAGVVPLVYVFGSWLDFADLPFRMPPVFRVIGILLFSVAIWLLHRSHSDLGKAWSPAVTPDPTQRLVVEGVYRRIRHPMYAAHVVWGVAQAMVLPNLIAGPLALILILLVIALRIPREEKEMTDLFGDGYRRYMSRTGRIFPRLRA